MDGDESESRFSALVSGTAVEQMRPGLLLKRQNQGSSTRPMSPAIFTRQSQQPRSIQCGSMLAQDESGPYRVDPVRRFRPNDAQNVFRMNSSKLVSHTLPGSSNVNDEAEHVQIQHEAHISNEAVPPTSRATRSGSSGVPTAIHQFGFKDVTRSNIGLLRSSKSLKQRFGVTNADDREEPSSDPPVPDVPSVSGYGSATVLQERPSEHHPVHRENTQRLKSHSRSASVVSSVFGRQNGQDEDISSIMMRGATDLRNAKYETEEQLREIAYLQSQIEILKSEKEEVLHRLRAVKDAAKRGLESSSKSLDGMRISLDSLKAQSEECFTFSAQAKASLPCVEEMRVAVDDTVKRIEPLLNDEGHFYKSEETKRVISEMQLDYDRSQQVVDLLRERLQSVGAELIDAKGRIIELEATQVADREALRALSSNLSASSEQIHNVFESFKKQQTELHEALTSAADFETRLAATEQETAHLKEVIATKEAELDGLNKVKEEKAQLEYILEERNSRMMELETLQSRLDTAQSLSNEKSVQISSLETFITSKDQAIVEYIARIEQKEAMIEECHTELQVLKKDLGARETREQAILKDLSRSIDEVAEMKAKSIGAERLLEEARSDIEARVKNQHQIDTAYKVLEERFETQSITLRITKEAQGDIQERMIESEAKFARELEAAAGKYEREIAVLSEQKSVLQVKIRDLEEAIHLQEQATIAIKVEYEAKLRQQDENHQSQLVSESERTNSAQTALADMQVAVNSLEVQLASGKDEIASLKDELKQAKLPSPAHQETVDVLNAQIAALRSENTDVLLRTRNIDTRWRAGDLNEEEKLFVNTLIHTSQSVHEQELVANGNELRRRDNTIKELQARIKLLENTLAKHLNTQTKTVTGAGLENRSLIDPSAFVRSSDTNSSPPKAPEEDMPSTNVDITVAAKLTPAPARMAARPPLAALVMPAPNIMVRTPGPARPHRPTVAGVKGTPVPALHKNTPISTHKAHLAQYAPERSSPLVPPKTPAMSRGGAPKTAGLQRGSKTMFGRLATDCSDDILEFEEKNSQLSPIDGTSPSEQPLAKSTGLGKRAKPSDAISPSGSQNNGRYAKRPRTTRSRTTAQGERREDYTSKTVPALPKTRTRKRR